MKDMPMFTTESGVASLTLSNIPYTKAAYIQIHDTCEPEKFIKECCDFCVAVGAESVFAAGNACLERYSHYTDILTLECFKNDLPPANAITMLVDAENAERWREIYWDRMVNVPNASYISNRDMMKRLETSQCFFVFHDDREIGIGMCHQDEITVVVGTVPGMGREVVLALAQNIVAEKIKVTVANENRPAMDLYERLGFTCTEVISKWYKIY